MGRTAGSVDEESAEPGAAPRRAEGFWTRRKVAWYRRALDRSDYSTRVLEAIEPLLAGAESALDVGAGCGALTLPLAGRLRRVTALEPSPAMAAALRREVAARGLPGVEVLETPWGAAPLAPHDLVLCAHVGELTRPGAPFLAAAAAAARRWVVVVRDAASEGDKFFFRELYPRLLGRPYATGSDYQETVAALAALGIRPGAAVVGYRSDQPFDDLEEACDFWEEYLGVSGASARSALRAFLESRLTREGTGWLAPYSKRAAVLWWPGAAPARA